MNLQAYRDNLSGHIAAPISQHEQLLVSVRVYTGGCHTEIMQETRGWPFTRDDPRFVIDKLEVSWPYNKSCYNVYNS